jgi:ankyrin repeat protein
MLAAGKGNPLVVKQLLLAGAVVNASDNMGGSALLEACKGGHDDTIRWANGQDAVHNVTAILSHPTISNICWQYMHINSHKVWQFLQFSTLFK